MSPAQVKASPKTFVVDLAERVVTTFVQVLLATVLAYTGVHVMWADAAAVAAFAAFGSFLTTTLVWLTAIKVIENPYLDLAYRAGITFLQTLLGVVLAAGTISALSFDWSFAAKSALVATGYSLLKGLIGLNNTRTLGASAVVLKPQQVPRRHPSPYPIVR